MFGLRVDGKLARLPIFRERFFPFYCMRTSQSYLFPILSLLGNAIVWGLIWWPLKELRLEQWHPLWSTAAVFGLACVCLMLARPKALASLRTFPQLWIVGVAAGVTNGAFNWGIAIGDVVRVILLFYLMPVWSAVLARVVLNEPITPLAIGRIVLALAGAALVLMPAGGGVPVPSGLADWLGLAGGMAFALNNVMIRRQSELPEDGRSLAMFIGGMVIPLAVALALCTGDAIALPPVFTGHAAVVMAGLGIAMIVANIALQHGAAALPANITAVVMLTEIVVAAVSSVLFGGAVFTPSMLAGAALILTASALAAMEGRSKG
ncbi:MAG: putative transrane protein [Herminiimonas sp.]|nr:putative transrane protein [Herminiimonas sp.]MDB5855273.1 putative transrane protein [Herminiimonas sp.]